MSETLSVRFTNNGTTGAVFRDLNGTLTQIGNTFTITAQPDATQSGKSNYAIAFDGYYCNGNGTIRKLDSAGVWQAETLPAFSLANAQSASGFFIGRGPTGVPRLVCLLLLSGNIMQSLYKEPGGAWTLGGSSLALGGATTHVWKQNTVKHLNSIIGTVGSGVFSYDVAQDAWTLDTTLENGSAAGDTFGSWCRGRGRVFGVAGRQGGGPTANTFLNLYELIGGTVVQVVDGSASTPNLAQNSGSGNPFFFSPSYDCFYDGTLDRVILVAYPDRGVGNRGLQVFSIDPDTQAVVDLTATVAPSAIAFPNGPSATNDAHISTFIDNEADVANPTVVIRVLLLDGSFTYYQYTLGGATEMTLLGSGGDRGIAPSRFFGGGVYNYAGGANIGIPRLLESAAREPIAGGTRIFFTGYTLVESGSAADLIQNARLYFGLGVDTVTDNEGTITAVAKVSGPAPAPTLNGNLIEGITCDNGATVYSLDWSAETDDSIPSGTNHETVLRIEL